MSLASILGRARSALLSHQLALDVTSRNITNASIPGYSRQRVIYEAVPGLVGGVRVAEISRIRDTFLDASLRREASLLGGSTTTNHFLTQVEAAFNEPSDAGISNALDELFQAFSDLATAPASTVHREEVRSAGERFAHRLRQLHASLSGAVETARARMEDEVNEANDLVEQIAALNGRIATEDGGSKAELQDSRDVMIDRLSELMPLEAIQVSDGTTTITANGVTLVQGGLTTALEVKTLTGGGFGVGSTSMAGALNLGEGSLAALSELTATTLPDKIATLDDLAGAVVVEINTLHRTGFTLSGFTGVDFFDPGGVSAETIGLSAAVTSSTNAIAAGSSSAPGDAGLASQIAGLGSSGISALGGQSFQQYYSDLVATVGRETRNASRDVVAARTLVESLDFQRQGISGVSVEEEMVHLISQQEAFGAAARLVRMADELMDDVLSLV